MADTIPGPPEIHPALLRHTGFLVSRLGHVAQREFSQRIASLGLTTRMWGALNVLDHAGAISQHALCQAVDMDPSSMVSTIDELEAQELVERRRHPTDRRAHALHLTEAGRERLAQGRKLAAAAAKELFGPLSREEREQLHSLLLRLVMAAEERKQSS